MTTETVTAGKDAGTSSKYTEERTFWHVILWAIGAYCFGVSLLGLAFGISEDSFSGGIKIFATAIVVGAAVAVGGGLLGFLFGMPKAFSTERSGSPTTGAAVLAQQASRATETSGAERRSATSTQSTAPEREAGAGWANNNLVEVSDWLTKIVVGVSLVQLNNIVIWVGGAGSAIGVGAGLENPLAKGFGVAVILLNFSFGFLVTYIYARTLLTVMFAAVWRRIEDEYRREMEPIRDALKAQEHTTEDVRSMVLEMAKDVEASTVFAQLYRPAPKGFRKAIKLAEALLRESEHKDDAKLWGYLACAYGQQHGYFIRTGKSDLDIGLAADKALEAVQKALEIDSSKKDWLRGLWDKNDPGYRSDEGDLESLWTDPSQRDRFAKLLAG